MTVLLVLVMLLFSGCGAEVRIHFLGEGAYEAAYLVAISFECPEGFVKTSQAIGEGSVRGKNIVCTRVIE